MTKIDTFLQKGSRRPTVPKGDRRGLKDKEVVSGIVGPLLHNDRSIYDAVTGTEIT